MRRCIAKDSQFVAATLIDRIDLSEPAMSLSRFVQDQDGSILPAFAMALVVGIGATAAAVDYSRASAARTAVANALDATGLMLAKEAESLTPAELASKATAYFNANMGDSA